MPSSRLARIGRRVPYTLAIAALCLGASDAPVPADEDAPIADVAIAAPALAHESVASAAHADGPVAGWVVDTAGAPIAGVRVRFRDVDVAADTDGQGAFHLVPPAGPNHVLLLDGAGVFAAELPWRPNEPPPHILMSRRARLEVRVTANGAPVADAEVQISDGSKPVLASARTDRDGAARFDDLLPGPYEVWARRDTAASPLVRVEDAAKPDTVALALAPAGSVHGQLLADAPLPPDASVQLVPLDVDHAVRVATSDPTGKFTFDGVPRGKWRLEARATGYDAAEQIVDASGAVDEVSLRLQRAGIASGTVVDQAGAPVANARIVLRQQGAAPRAADDVRPVFNGRLRWVHPLAGHRIMPKIDAARFGAQRPGVRPAECGQGHCGIDIGNQRGTIIHAAGDGEIIGAWTEIRGEAGRMVAIDHGNGLHTMYMHLDQVRPGLEPGMHIRAGEPLGTMGTTGFALDNPHLHFAVTQEREGRSWYIDPEPMLRTAVVLPAPRSLDTIVAGASVVAATVRAGDTKPAPTGEQALLTDAQGRFRLDGISPGTYVAVAFAEQLAPGVSGPFAVKSGAETGGVIVTLKPGVLVRGRVIGRDGPIDGATLTAAAGFGESANKVAMTYTNKDGEFVLRALTGKVTLVASAPGYGELERTIALDDSAAQRREDFVLVVENAQLSGQVLAHDGGAAGPLAIRVVDGPTHRSFTSDATGRFTLGRVATGTYVLEVTSPDYPPLRVRMQTGEFKELRFEEGGGARVTVRDPRGGDALANARIEATGPAGATASRTTDAAGAAELRGLTAGEWTLAVRAPGFAPARQTVTIRVGRTADVALDVSRSATLAGVVRDRFGRRVAGAKVTFGGVATQTDDDGNFRLADAPSGSGWLEAELDGARGATQVQINPGDERASLTVELQ